MGRLKLMILQHQGHQIERVTLLPSDSTDEYYRPWRVEIQGTREQCLSHLYSLIQFPIELFWWESEEGAFSGQYFLGRGQALQSSPDWCHGFEGEIRSALFSREHFEEVAQSLCLD